MRRHIDIIAYLHIAQSILILLAGGIALLTLAGSGLISGERETIWITSALGLFVAFVMTLIAVPGLFVAYGLLKRRSWGRVGGLVLGALDLFNFPFGTVLGAYTFWALLNDEAHRIFASSSQRAPLR